jgi:hypothetical protein
MRKIIFLKKKYHFPHFLTLFLVIGTGLFYLFSPVSASYGSNFLINGKCTDKDSEFTIYPCENAFDSNLFTYWLKEGKELGSIKYDTGDETSHVANRMNLYGYSDSKGKTLKDFTLTGSNDDIEYFFIASSTTSESTSTTWEVFTFSNVTSYRYFVLTIDSNWRTDSYTGIVELELMPSTTSTIGIYNGFTYGEIMATFFLFMIFVILVYAFIFFWIKGLRVKS